MNVKTIDTLQDVPAPHSDRIIPLQIPYPVNHHLDRRVDFGFEYWPAELRPYISQHGVVLRHLKDYEDAEEGLRPAKEVRY